jgi:HK97 family phage major capsid protein
MSTYVDSLLEKRANVWSQATEILDRAETEKRALTAEEQAGYDSAMTDMRALAEQAERLDADKKSADAAEASLRSLANRPEQRPAQSADDQEDQLRAFMQGKSGRSFEVNPTKAELRVLSKASAGAGANTVPTSFYGSLWEHLRDNATLIKAGATVLTTDGGENFEIPTTSGHGAAAQVAENGTIAASDPVFVKRTLGAWKYGQLIQVSRELVDDTGVDLLGYLARVTGENLGNVLGTDLVLGAGTTEPFGITVSATTGVTGSAAVAGVFTMDNLIDLYYSVIAPYRNKSAAAWLMRDATAASIRKLKDGSGGAGTGGYVWQPSVVAGQPDLLLSKPVYTDPNIAAVAADAKSVVFGDISSYFVRVVNGIRFERSDDFAFNTDQVTFRGLIRADGALIDQTGAVKTFVGGAAA